MNIFNRRIKKYIRPVDEPIYGKASHKEGLSVPATIMRYGSFISKVKTMPIYSRYMARAMREILKSTKSINKNPYHNQKEITPELLSELEGFIKLQGVSSIGYTMLKETHLFQESVVLFKNAIVFTMEMKKPEIEVAPSTRTGKEIFRTYYELGRAVNLTADFLRERGFNAQAIPALSNNLNLTVMARDAGLGGFGKNGLLISKEFGPSIRIAAVLTDIENLPMNQELNHEWIQTFCNSCNACVRKCPAQAIYEQPIVFEDGSEQHIDYKKCAMPFSKHDGCTICVKECTFFKTDYDKIKKAVQKS